MSIISANGNWFYGGINENSHSIKWMQWNDIWYQVYRQQFFIPKLYLSKLPDLHDTENSDECIMPFDFILMEKYVLNNYCLGIRRRNMLVIRLHKILVHKGLA